MSSSDSEPELSSETLRILQQVMQEQQEQQERFEQLRQQAEERFDEVQDADSANNNNKAEKDLSMITMDFFREDWQMSQFWYDENTSEQLAREVLENTDKDSLVCCISSPTAYVKLMSMKPPTQNNNFLFEYDTRFDVYGRQFIHYDYSHPLEFRLAQELKNSVDLIVVDPPFLAEECLTKTLETVRFLLKDGGKVVLCTGAVMEPIAKKDGLLMTSFYPGHQNGLSNDFRCYVNYKSERFPFKNDQE